MEKRNLTGAPEFILLGFQNLHNFRLVFFIFLLVIYCVTVCGNLLIIILVLYSRDLQTPMYLFLSQLSTSDILVITDIVPKLLDILLYEEGRISFAGCIVQFYLIAVLEISECLLLTVMSYDRYLAICKPLHYNSIMDTGFCLKLIIISWLLSLFSVLIITITICLLQFCGPYFIDHFFCDLAPILRISCSDTSIIQLEATLMSIPILIIPFSVLIISYIYILVVILKIPSTTGRQKAFSTCSSHLTVVSLFYCTLFVIYGRPTTGQSSDISKVLSLLYTVGTPLINPIIYSLRNEYLKKYFEICISNVVAYTI